MTEAMVLHPETIERFDRGTGVQTIPLIGKWNAEDNKVTTGITIFGPGTGIPLHTRRPGRITAAASNEQSRRNRRYSDRAGRPSEETC